MLEDLTYGCWKTSYGAEQVVSLHKPSYSLHVDVCS